MFNNPTNDDCLVGMYNRINFSVMKTNEEIYKVGDRVYDYQFGWGEVVGLNTRNYPICVQFVNNSYAYTNEGFLNKSNKYPTLSFTEYDFINGGFSQVRPFPGLAVDTPIFVRRKEGGNWYLRYFSHFNTDGQAVSFEGQLKSTETKDTSTWSEYSLTNPLL